MGVRKLRQNMDLSPSNFPSIRKWICENQRASNHVSFIDTKGNQEKILQFQQNREKIVKQLRNTLKQLNALKDQAIESITKITQEPFMKLGNLCFDDQAKNLNLRKLVFLHREIQITELLLNNTSLDNYMEQIEDIQKIIALLESEIIPKHITCKVDENCFMITFNKTIQQLIFQTEALRNCCKRLEKETREYEPPKWVKDFKGFLHDTLSKNVEHLDTTLSYVPQLPDELPLSRYCFSEIGNEREIIDGLIETIFQVPPIDFLHNVLDTALRLIPDPESFTAEEQSIGLLIFFRIIFDRVYELHSDILIKPISGESNKMNILSSLPCRIFNLPKESAPEFKDDEEIRTVFRRDCYYRSAAMFLEGVMFITNPIDCLYLIHKTLLSINKAALMQRMKEKEASLDDLHQLLCFDDLFVLFLGVYLSSDLYEFLSIASFVAEYSPTFCLSNSFEYAQASLESLVKHIESMSPDELLKK